MLTLTKIAEDPRVLTYRMNLSDGSTAVLRPLTHADTERLAVFLRGLSAESRRFSTFDGYGLAAARDLCAAIARYDKLRLVLEDAAAETIIGLFELSLAITAGDLARYRAAGIRLTETTDCRFGPTLADAYQGRKVGTLAFPLVTEIVRRLGRTRIILWGGVLADNARAIRFYEKNGFQHIGSFTRPDGIRSLDMMLDLRSRPSSEAV
ncbi:GNAT family N-acetyltransferase [Actinoallomurus sp. NPDC052274]|uniref:GNAT family N-acetyltransferase n=1 Tax=Actinoallomurus sp. NPDC052274 TaxID=3155420 RepID=UPI00343E4768